MTNDPGPSPAEIAEEAAADERAFTDACEAELVTKDELIEQEEQGS